ncbi:DUF5701 family protein [Actinomadura xylanilytica]|uniref:DUF5701 family protein n=1 Tax=Actinomadura xylanilytica TaxID=887459 RepID=UPI00255A9BF8|nr:DUF5701 family protein [Actinomadura xylanilytica]MDL4775510.1 DUF5701 family protein [Actinomadura xylanilytica]
MTSTDAGTEFDRQVRTLLDKRYHEHAGLSAEAFTELLSPLRATVTKDTAAAGAGGTVDAPEEGRVPFVLVVTRELVPIEDSIRLTTVAGRTKPGVIDRHYKEGDIGRFVSTEETGAPDAPAYVLFGVERGEEFCGAVPNDAMAAIAGRGRTPLTIEEGIALVTQHPSALAKNKCFSLGGSRCGDRRVPAIWISQNAPKLGWCWAGNPHTWLGMASAAARA